MGSDIKQASFSPEYHESSQFDHNERHPGPSRALEASRMGLSIIALASAVGILATSAHNLKIYNDTHVANDFLLPLWPFEFNLGPSIALVACGSIMIVAAIASLLAGKIPSLRYNTSLHTLLTLLSAFAGLVSAIVATSFFYGINASDVTATIQSWSCHWSDVAMASEPDFHRICKQAEAGLYLTIMMIPLFALIGAVGIMAVVHDKKVSLMAARKGSPALS
ncbi:hypothetical protein V500_00329 [Pseudogymnoascus sp. VKM F-4518 (FW-2643)]|nr:hypothetical protein V500_00329 [Pseudogymnoascus sp. VKM F-4518 (FW-2643)]